MKNKIKFKKRNFIFIFISLFFYIFMIILFWNLSFMMFKNASVMIAMKESETLKNITENFKERESDKISISLLNVVENLYNKNHIRYLVISNKEGKILYNKSNNIYINKKAKFIEINPINRINFLDNFIDKDLYQVIFFTDKEDKIYFNIIYDLSYISKNYFQNKKEIFLVVSILNFMILFFLSIMILNLQRRLNIKEQYINELKTTDEITGLLSKEYFLKLLKKESERIQRTSGKIALLTIDIDNFLNINEKYGYEFGTIVLQTISRIIESNFRNFDLIARFGDDEFIVLMVDSDENNGYEAAERCRFAIEENKFYYEGKSEITITVSIGIADSILPLENMKKHPSESGNNFFRTILFNSLNALARAKREGRNKIVKYTDILK